MPQIPRGQVTRHAYHILNRGNGGATVFHKDRDYAAFLDLLATAKRKFSVKVFGVCLMPNHFQLVLQPATETTLSPFMQWWMTSHVRRYHQHYRSHGRVWQGRFKSFPIQQDGHLLTAIRYVLRNPVRAGLVEHAMDWPWSNLRFPHLSDPVPCETTNDGFSGSISRCSIMNSRPCGPASTGNSQLEQKTGQSPSRRHSA